MRLDSSLLTTSLCHINSHYNYNKPATFSQHPEAPQRRHDDASHAHLHSLHGRSRLRRGTSQVS